MKESIQAGCKLGVVALLAASSIALAMEVSPEYREHTRRKQMFLADANAYPAQREARRAAAVASRFGAEGTLSVDETEVDCQLQKHLANFLASTRNDFPPSQPFYVAKEKITHSESFKMLRKMPKGALLHAHLMAVGRVDWVVQTALSSSNCYVQWHPAERKNRGTLRIYAPENAPTNQHFYPVAEMVRKFSATNTNAHAFADALREALTFGKDDVGSGVRPWDEMGRMFGLTGDFIRTRSVFTNYLLDAFQTLWDDGVYHVELRDTPKKLSDSYESGCGDNDEYIRQIETAVQMMRAKHSNFTCRLIFSGFRAGPADSIIDCLNEAVQWRDRYPNLFVGFDLIGEEKNPGDGTQVKAKEVIQLLSTSHRSTGPARKGQERKHLPYFLHDGESAWGDNDNLIDAVTLGVPRIGHAFNLFRFPFLYEEIRTNHIALEICPISNQLLGLTPDLRTHPAAGYLNAGLPCVLASDDPLYFGNDGLSCDFWMAMVAWNLDLAAVKMLARHSITHSGLDPHSKSNLMVHWTREWNRFIASNATRPNQQK